MQRVQGLIPIASALLLALAAWLSAVLCWKVVELVMAEPATVVASPTGVAKPEASAGPAFDMQALLEVPLFGEPDIFDTAPVAAEFVKRSNLQIRLLGVVAGGDQGVAILKHDGKEYAYKVGEKLDVREPITLVSVEPEYVIISRSAGNEKIELEKPREMGRGDNRIRRVNREGVAATVDLNDPSIRRLIGDPKQTLNRNPLRLTRYISAHPHMENGKTVGFAVQPGRDKRLFGQLGLQPGDVIVSINNQRVGEAAVGDLINSVNSSESVEVQLLRDGLQQTIRLNL